MGVAVALAGVAVDGFGVAVALLVGIAVGGCGVIVGIGSLLPLLMEQVKASLSGSAGSFHSGGLRRQPCSRPGPSGGEATVVVGIDGDGIVAIDRRGVGDTVPASLASTYCTIGAATEQEVHDARLSISLQLGTGRFVQEPLYLVVLMVVQGVVHRNHLGILKWNLPMTTRF
jgi:hypothetical protein